MAHQADGSIQMLHCSSVMSYCVDEFSLLWKDWSEEQTLGMFLEPRLTHDDYLSNLASTLYPVPRTQPHMVNTHYPPNHTVCQYSRPVSPGNHLVPHDIHMEPDHTTRYHTEPHANHLVPTGTTWHHMAAGPQLAPYGIQTDIKEKEVDTSWAPYG